MAFIAFSFILGGIYFYLLIRRQSFWRAGCFLHPAGGQPGRASLAPAWGREERGDATVGKKPPWLHTGILEEFLRAGKTHQGAKRGLLDEHGNSKVGERWGAPGRLLAFKVKRFSWGMGQKNQKGFW